MPEAAIAAPAAPPPTPTINVPSKPSLPVHRPTPETDTSGTRESARQMFRKRLEEKFGAEPETPPAEKPKVETPTPPTEPETPEPKEAEPTEEPTVEATDDKKEKTEKSKKESPWKIVENYKKRTKALEQELSDLKATIKPESDVKAMQTELERLRTSLKEKENFLRLHHYQQSDDYRNNFEKPWEAAWQKTAKQMSEITVTDPTSGAERQATVHDIERLVNSPLGAARRIADEMFGPFANDAMAMRGKIVELYEAREEALNKAKANGETWQKEQAENQAKQSQALRQEISDTWKKSNESFLADEKVGQYFKQREGDEEWNNRLTKGTELVDKAFATLKPDFSSGEPRAEVIKRHAAIRHRAIAFGPLRHAYEQAVSERDSWKKKYEAIAKSTPPAAPESPQDKAKEGAPTDYRAQLRAALLKTAH